MNTSSLHIWNNLTDIFISSITIDLPCICTNLTPRKSINESNQWWLQTLMSCSSVVCYIDLWLPSISILSSPQYHAVTMYHVSMNNITRSGLLTTTTTPIAYQYLLVFKQHHLTWTPLATAGMSCIDAYVY